MGRYKAVRRDDRAIALSAPAQGDNNVICTSTAYGTAAGLFDEAALVDACKDGDAKAFEQLVSRYDGKLLRIAQHITHNLEDAEDAVQEAFLKAFRKLHQFREDAQFSTWLVRITVNESLMKLRKRHSCKEVAFDSDFQSEGRAPQFQLADWAPNPEELYSRSELRNILRNELRELPPGLKVVFVLRDMESLSTDQTAEVLGLTATAVKARLWRARAGLRERLNKYFARPETDKFTRSKSTNNNNQIQGE